MTSTVSEAIADPLVAEPLFHMSLGSKELFHSNLLAWLSGRYADEAREIFARWATPAEYRGRGSICREAGNLDLVLQFDGFGPVVIENKVFSLPDEQQLERYAAGPAKTFGSSRSLVLLSLADPRWEDGTYPTPHGSWKHVSYAELRSAIEPHLPAVRRKDDYDGQTLEHYCRLIRTLVELADLVSVRKADESVLLQSNIVRPLAAARVGDAAQKLRTHQIGAALRAKLAKEALGVRFSSGFTNGEPLLEAFVPLGGEDMVGWQYQHEQFRLALILASRAGRGETARREREAYARRYESWFDFGLFEQLVAGGERGRRRIAADGFNGYEPDFIYRYRRAEGITVGQVLELGARYVRAARAFAAEQGSM